MDWANERYVRLFTRDTPEWLCMEWQGRALWPLMIRKADRSGVIANKLGTRGLAVLVGLPMEVVEPGLASLLADGCLQTHQLGYVIPNYIEAQETPQSDAQRQRESRERRRMVTNRDTESQNVTECHATSRGVTRCHAVSQVVTPDQSGPVRTSPDLPDPPVAPQGALLPDPVKPAKAKRAKRPAFECTDQERASALLVLGKLGDRNGTAYEGCDEHVRLIVEQLRRGRTEMDLRKVIAYCAEVKRWEDDPEWRHCLNPATLFGPKNITRYLDEARSWAARVYPEPKLEVVK